MHNDLQNIHGQDNKKKKNAFFFAIPIILFTVGISHGCIIILWLIDWSTLFSRYSMSIIYSRLPHTAQRSVSALVVDHRTCRSGYVVQTIAVLNRGIIFRRTWANHRRQVSAILYNRQMIMQCIFQASKLADTNVARWKHSRSPIYSGFCYWIYWAT